MIQKIKQKAKEWLLWSQKYTKTDMLYLARGGFWLTLGQIISTGSSFLLAIAFANLLPKEIYGTYRFVLAAASIIAIPTLQGINTSLIQSVARGFDGSLIPALKTKLKWGVLASIAGLLLSGYYFWNNNIELTIAFLIVSAFLPFSEGFGIYDSFLYGKKLFRVSTKYFVVSQIVSIASLISVIFLTDNLFLILLAYFVPWVVMRLLFLRLTIRQHPTESETDSQMIPFGKHLTLMNVLGIIAGYLDRLLIFHYLGAAEVAIYSIAIAPPEQIKGLFKNVGSLALPKLSESSEGYKELKIIPKTLKLFWGIAAITAIYILLAPTIFRLFFPAYGESVFLSQIFATSLVAASSIIPSSFLSARGEKKKLYVYNVSYSIVQIATLFIFINFYGLLGVIFSRVLSRFISTITALLLIRN